MEELLDQLGEAQSWKDCLRSACKENNLSTSLAGELTPSKLGVLKERFKKSYELNPEQFSESWIQHEMKAFSWILIVLSALQRTKITDFGPQEWKRLFSLFPNKKTHFLSYQTKRFLLQKCTKNKNWAPDENQLLSQIMSGTERDKISWNQIARALFQQSKEKYFRTAKHCRERWLNYLDPSKERGDWTREQDIELLESIEQHGKKWAKIGALLNRTQHNIKNRFNSMLSKQKLSPSLRQEQKLLEQAKTALQPKTGEQTGEKDDSKIKVKLKTSSDSLFNESRSSNRQAFMSFGELDRNKSAEYLQDFTVEGGQFVKHLVKEDEAQSNKNSTPGYPSFWCNSPKNLTPMGLNPSPLCLNYGLNQYLHNFNMEIQRQSQKQEEV